jgi:hypothetical protein
MHYQLEKYPLNYTKHELILKAYKDYSKKDGDYYDYEHLLYLIPHCERHISKYGITRITAKDYQVVERAIAWFNNISKEAVVMDIAHITSIIESIIENPDRAEELMERIDMSLE